MAETRLFWKSEPPKAPSMPAPVPAPSRKPSRTRAILRFFRRAFLVLLGLVVIATAAAYLFRDRIGAELKTRLEAQLADRGINVEYTTSEFAPFRGLTIQDLKIFRDASRETTAVTLSKARLRYDLLGILRGRSGASVQLSTNGAGLVLSDVSGDYAIEDLDTSVSIDRSGTEIRELAGNFRDVRFDVDGELGWENGRSSDSAPEETKERPDPSERVIDLSPILQWLDQVPDTADGGIDLRLTLERPGYPAPMTVSGTITGDTVRWKELSATDVDVAFSLVSEPEQPPTLEFSKIRLTIDDRDFAASGSVDFEAEKLALSSLRTGLNPASFQSLLPKEKADTPTLPSLPPYQLEGSGTLDLESILSSELSGKLTAAGPAEIPMGERAPLIFSGLSTDYRWANGKIELADLTAHLGKDGPLKIGGNFSVLLPGDDPEAGTRIGFPRFQLTRGEQSLAATGTLDLAAGKLTLDSLDSGVDIGGLLTDLGFEDPISSHARFPEAPKLTAAGEISLGSVLAGSNLSGTFQAPAIQVPAGENRVAEIAQLETGYTLGDGQLALSDFRTAVFGGSLGMPAMNLGLTETPVTFDGRLDFDTLQLQAITDFLNAEKRRTGTLSGFFEGNGSSDPATLNGNGKIEIVEAEFSTVPIFRALRPLLSAITLSDWRGEQEGADLTSSFAFTDGVMKSDDILLEGDFYEVKADADVDFGQRTLAANGYVSTSGATKVLTQVVGKALEVEASGTFDDFSWKLKNAPGVGTVGDLTGLSKDLIGKTLGAAAGSGIPQAVVGGVKDTLTSGKPVQGAANMAEETLKGVTGVGKKLLGIGRKKDREKEDEEENKEPETPPASPEANGPEPESGN